MSMFTISGKSPTSYKDHGMKTEMMYVEIYVHKYKVKNKLKLDKNLHLHELSGIL